MNNQVAVSSVSPNNLSSNAISPTSAFLPRVSLEELAPSVALPRISLQELAPGASPVLRAPITASESAAMLGAAGVFPISAVPLRVSTHAAGAMRISRYPVDVTNVPVDFFADPDGAWDFDSLVESAGFDPENPGVCIGALVATYDGHPAGSAVVTEVGRARSYVAIVECPVADGSASQANNATAQRVEPAGTPRTIPSVTRAA